jgi:integrase
MPPAGLPKGVELRSSGRFRGRLTFRGQRYYAEFDAPKAAAAWRVRTRSELVAGTYVDPATGAPPSGTPLFREYAAAWVEARPLKPRTRSEYRKMLSEFAAFDAKPLDRISRADVQDWYAALAKPATARKHVYELLRAIMNSAVDDEHIVATPVRIKGAGRPSPKPMPDLPTAEQVKALADAMPTPKYRVMTLIAAWCGLRFGELTELRRGDVILGKGAVPLILRVRRGVTRVDGERVVGGPKSEAGKRDVTIPPHIRGDIADYLETLPHAPDTLLFAGTRNGAQLAPSSLYKPFYRARKAAGVPELRWHDLRHFAGTAAARTGATLAEVQARLGHSTVAAAMRYQHAAKGRDAVIADALSAEARRDDA